MPKRHIVWSDGYLKTEDYEKRNGHRSGVVWFTGLSGSGKSTVARALQHELFGRGCMVYVLDGDNVRHGLNSDLGFDETDRKENIRRISEVAGLFQSAGFIVLTAFISPFREDRDRARKIIEPAPFVEVFVDTDIEVCQTRDPKGLYKKALNGDIKDFTGISSPYEAPEKPEIVLPTTEQSVEQSVEQIIGWMENEKWFEG
ncbi:MAG TPA: adenylyl-sulfate kinase [Balneolales bacterium]|nr:adenylyl-sulfate kinase [Balneolales bacterium]